MPVQTLLEVYALMKLGNGDHHPSFNRVTKPVEETMTKTLAAAFVMMICAGSVIAAEASCTTQATEKKLVGAAKTSFMTKCEKDMKAACDTQASEKKLSGAAKTSFTNKCVKDSVGT